MQSRPRNTLLWSSTALPLRYEASNTDAGRSEPWKTSRRGAKDFEQSKTRKLLQALRPQARAHLAATELTGDDLHLSGSKEAAHAH